MTSSNPTPSALDLRDELTRLTASIEAVTTLLLYAIEGDKTPTRGDVNDAITLLDLVARQAKAAA